jgi:hypothetical protein
MGRFSARALTETGLLRDAEFQKKGEQKGQECANFFATASLGAR